MFLWVSKLPNIYPILVPFTLKFYSDPDGSIRKFYNSQYKLYTSVIISYIGYKFLDTFKIEYRSKFAFERYKTYTNNLFDGLIKSLNHQSKLQKLMLTTGKLSGSLIKVFSRRQMIQKIILSIGKVGIIGGSCGSFISINYQIYKFRYFGYLCNKHISGDDLPKTTKDLADYIGIEEYEKNHVYMLLKSKLEEKSIQNSSNLFPFKYVNKMIDYFFVKYEKDSFFDKIPKAINPQIFRKDYEQDFIDSFSPPFLKKLCFQLFSIRILLKNKNI